MIVVDTNLIGYLLLPSLGSPQAEEVLRRDPEWAAPLLWRSELRNALAVQVRTGRISLEHAYEVLAQAEELMRGREYAVVSQDVLRLASISRCTAYDCEFVALAQDLGVPLVTVDRQVLAAFPSLAQTPEQYSA